MEVQQLADPSHALRRGMETQNVVHIIPRKVTIAHDSCGHRNKGQSTPVNKLQGRNKRMKGKE